MAPSVLQNRKMKLGLTLCQTTTFGLVEGSRLLMNRDRQETKEPDQNRVIVYRIDPSGTPMENKAIAQWKDLTKSCGHTYKLSKGTIHDTGAVASMRPGMIVRGYRLGQTEKLQLEKRIYDRDLHQIAKQKVIKDIKEKFLIKQMENRSIRFSPPTEEILNGRIERLVKNCYQEKWYEQMKLGEKWFQTTEVFDEKQNKWCKLTDPLYIYNGTLKYNAEDGYRAVSTLVDQVGHALYTQAEAEQILQKEVEKEKQAGNFPTRKWAYNPETKGQIFDYGGNMSLPKEYQECVWVIKRRKEIRAIRDGKIDEECTFLKEVTQEEIANMGETQGSQWLSGTNMFLIKNSGMNLKEIQEIHVATKFQSFEPVTMLDTRLVAEFGTAKWLYRKLLKIRQEIIKQNSSTSMQTYQPKSMFYTNQQTKKYHKQMIVFLNCNRWIIAEQIKSKNEVNYTFDEELYKEVEDILIKQVWQYCFSNPSKISTYYCQRHNSNCEIKLCGNQASQYYQRRNKALQELNGAMQTQAYRRVLQQPEISGLMLGKNVTCVKRSRCQDLIRCQILNRCRCQDFEFLDDAVKFEDIERYLKF